MTVITVIIGYNNDYKNEKWGKEEKKINECEEKEKNKQKDRRRTRKTKIFERKQRVKN